MARIITTLQARATEEEGGGVGYPRSEPSPVSPASGLQARLMPLLHSMLLAGRASAIVTARKPGARWHVA